MLNFSWLGGSLNHLQLSWSYSFRFIQNYFTIVSTIHIFVVQRYFTSTRRSYGLKPPTSNCS